MAKKSLVRARVGLYEGRGDYQLIVEHLEPAGLGDLQRQFDLLKQKLFAEGLFNDDHKQPLPTYPRHIGVITSPTGAVIRDIIHVTGRRYPNALISVFPVAVQGEAAAQQIVTAIDNANRLSDCDVLILGRGGGSLEDLWPFNEEAVARAVYASKLPIISAVGHETDVTIADFVADVRAPTPSAAAELATPDREELLQQFVGYRYLLTSAIENQLNQRRADLKLLRSRLRHPGQALQSQAQHLDNLEIRLRRAIVHNLQHASNQHQQLHTRLEQISPAQTLASKQGELQHLKEKLVLLTRQRLALLKGSLASQAALLDSVSPLTVLKRGYSITTRESDQQLLTNSEAIRQGDRIRTKLNTGQVISVVETVER